MKKMLAIVLALMLVFSATAAFAADYEIVSKGFQHQYWQAVLAGAQAKAAELGVEINFVGPANESAYDEQLSQLNSAINAAPKAIGLAALSTETCLDAIKTAQESGIPIIGFDSGVPGAPEGAILANCATNNYNAGALAGEMVYAAIKDRIAAAEGTVRIGVSAQDAVSESVTQRGLGFIDKIGELAAADGFSVKLEGNEKYVNDAKVESVDDGKIVIETLVPSQVTAELSAIDCQNLLNKSDIIALYGSNQHSAEAMVTANENLQKL
ncbi:MAG: substrate-binding domain-containing protein, partial [Clostridia bacterium]|nr:substrate-binding domain-containing protein [Clostridia bacterium]